MKLNVTQQVMQLADPTKPVLTRPKNDPETGEPDPESKPLTLRFALVEALLAPYKGEEKLEQGKKLNRWHLAQRIQHNDEVSLKLDEAALCKRLVLKAFHLGISGPVTDMLEQSVEGEVPDAPEEE